MSGVKQELSALILSVGTNAALSCESISRTLANLSPDDLLSGEFVAVVDRADFITLNQSTFDVQDKEETAGVSHENFVAAFIKKAISIFPPFLEQLLLKIKKDREGSVARHIILMQILSGIKHSEFQKHYSLVSHALGVIIEFVFTEIYQASTHQSSAYTGDQIKIMQSKGFQKIKSICLNFVKHNHDILSKSDSLLKISEYVRIEAAFSHVQIKEIPVDQINKAAFMKFLGGVIAKLEFAKYFSNLQSQFEICKLLAEFQGLFKPFHEKLMGDPLSILQAQAEYVSYRKTRELCLESMPKGQNLINLHAIIQVDCEEHYEPWSGYGANFCTYLLRQTILDGRLAVLSLPKRLGLICALLSTTPRDYLRGGDYYQPILEAIMVLRKLHESTSSICGELVSASSYGFRIPDFLFTLFTIAQQSHSTSKTIEDLISLLFSGAYDESIEYMTMLKVADILTDPRDLSSSEPFLTGFANTCFAKITSSLDCLVSGDNVFRPFLQESLLGRYFGALLRADSKQISAFRMSRYHAYSRSSWVLATNAATPPSRISALSRYKMGCEAYDMGNSDSLD
jgi:hypothetical protein